MKLKDLFEDEYEDEEFNDDENYEDEYDEEAERQERIEESIQDILYNLKKFCQPYMKINPDFVNNPLYRGRDLDHDDAWTDASAPHNRKPMDMPNEMSKLIDGGMRLAGFKATRSNSIFCSPSARQAQQYGELCVVFPQGDFSFTSSWTFTDLYTQRRDAFFKLIAPAILNKEDFPSKEEIDDIFYYKQDAKIEELLKTANIDKTKLAEAAREHFFSDDFADAMSAGHEILIGNDCILISDQFFHDHIVPELSSLKSE